MSNTTKKSLDKMISAKPTENRKFVLFDATNCVVGRLAAAIAVRLRGKYQLDYTPHADNGDFVIVTNADKAKFTSNKLKTKTYYRHTGYIGGIKTQTPYELQLKGQFERVLEKAVSGMLKNGPLKNKMLKRLRIVNGSEHDYTAQNPEVINFAEKKRQNVVS